MRNFKIFINGLCNEGIISRKIAKLWCHFFVKEYVLKKDIEEAQVGNMVKRMKEQLQGQEVEYYEKWLSGALKEKAPMLIAQTAIVGSKDMIIKAYQLMIIMSDYTEVSQ